MLTRTDPPGPARRPSLPLPLLMASACGVAVADVYFPQALVPLIARGLHVAPGFAALVATLVQLGYAAGIFLLVPLGDRLARRRLVCVLLVLCAGALLVAGLAPTGGVLLAASAAVGVVAVVPQLLLPLAATLAAPGRQASAIATLQGGLIAGILLARTFGAVLGERLTWRAPYLTAAALTALLALALARTLPATAPAGNEPYRVLLATTVRMLRTQEALRRSAFHQALLFAGFSAVWSALALLLASDRYRLDAQALGALALVGAGSLLASRAGGRAVERHGPERVGRWCAGGAVVSAAVLAAGGVGGVAGLVALGAGLVVLDVALQCGQIANQARIFALAPQARSRLNTAYMTCAFLGGAAGSWLGVRAWQGWGWPGVCALLALLAVLALAAPAPRTPRTPSRLPRLPRVSRLSGTSRTPSRLPRTPSRVSGASRLSRVSSAAGAAERNPS